MQGRGALKRELVACLRTGRALRVPRARTRRRRRTFVAPEIMISERPAEADDRAVPGHWEGDLTPRDCTVPRSERWWSGPPGSRCCCTSHPCQATENSNEPKTGPLSPATATEAVRDAIAASIITLPQQLRRSQTLGPRRRNGPTRSAPHRHQPGHLLLRPPEHHGNAEPTRTPTVSSASTSPTAPTSTDTHPPTSTLSPQHSTVDPAKRSTGRPPPRPSTNIYTPSNKAVLQRPLEPGVSRCF